MGDIVYFERDEPTGISILIAGGGIGGMTAAIECYRKGHDVCVVERRPDHEPLGEVIGIHPSAYRPMKNWPGFMDMFLANTMGNTTHFFRQDGSLIGRFIIALADEGVQTIALSRRELHHILCEYAASLGIEVAFRTRVKEYFETDTNAGVVLDDGRRLEADVVIAADGVGSTSWSVVTGYKVPAVSSGAAVYRASFPLEPVMRDPLLRSHLDGYTNRLSVHLGQYIHVIIGKSKEDICWLMEYPDDGNGTEDGNRPQSVEKALQHVKGWEPFVQRLIEVTPGGTVLDWKLMWRDPEPVWVSPKGRVAQIGDAAHTFIPTSGSGATMAMEDAHTIAVCLQLAGKDNISLATHVFNRLRFERVSCAQKTGFRTRDAWHTADWDFIARNPDIIGKRFGKWLLLHDPEVYAYENFDACAEEVRAKTEGRESEKPFVSTNIPPGYTHKPWTIQEMLQESAEKQTLGDEGDWS
ncbi:FAD/NAD(P)-binding domain-containing protein [Fistulina hepatica ATCC 64428]|uniref:FAD/NAD(P)-binding domain-containing protein n=1 Tax=Fistulina hepatica ATCC 64428 TaxID=1128425 RepID=A0A0D7AG04_9AGAR|nr:FAD/NAD(P)-binding domain-containing protein [Fistulina hepatica ATCC 64428]